MIAIEGVYLLAIFGISAFTFFFGVTWVWWLLKRATLEEAALGMAAIGIIAVNWWWQTL